MYNGNEETGYPGCVNLSFAYIEGESLLMALKDIALSSGRSVTGRETIKAVKGRDWLFLPWFSMSTNTRDLLLSHAAFMCVQCVHVCLA